MRNSWENERNKATEHMSFLFKDFPLENVAKMLSEQDWPNVLMKVGMHLLSRNLGKSCKLTMIHSFTFLQPPKFWPHPCLHSYENNS